MKILIFFALTTFTFFAHAQDSLVEISNFGTNPGNLEMLVYSPDDLNKNLKNLVIALHGCSQHAKDMAEMTGWNKLAKQNDFIMLYPQQKYGNNPSLCFNWFKENDFSGNDGETESIRQMIFTAFEKYPIDKTRIFITGLSAGAAMSVAMLLNYPDLFQAGASFSGGPYGIVKSNFSDGLKLMRGKMVISHDDLMKSIATLKNKSRTEYPKLYIYHGDEDPIVNIQNAGWLIEQWLGLYESEEISNIKTEKFAGNSLITQEIFMLKEGKEIVTYYKIKDLGHAIPIDPGNGFKQGGKAGVFSKDINFYSSYQVALDFGLIKK
jgi:poly(hydroxyalkanoate) depolymerase family esterase